MPDHPIACTVTTDQARDRAGLIAALRAEAMLDQRSIAGGLRTRLRDEPSVEQRVRELVAAERACCSFLAFDVRREAGALVLDITGSAEAQPVIAAFFAALEAQCRAVEEPRPATIR
ncbi:MAG TPA: hypothetical protein VIL49_18160 [Capillimicrobium sp.]|jgi:hypothetical protein